MNVTTKYYEAKDGSLHKTKKKRKKQNKLIKFMKSTKEICITIRNGCDPRIFLTQEDALGWVKSVSSENIVSSYNYEKLELPINELIKLKRKKNKPIFGRDS